VTALGYASSDQSDAVLIQVLGEPRGKGRPRSRIARAKSGQLFVSVYTDAQTREYEQCLRAAARAAMGGRAPLSGPLALTLIARFAVPASWNNAKCDAAFAGVVRPAKKPDIDNIAKMVDAFNGIVWRDDSQIVEASITKLYSREPALIVSVRQLSAARAEDSA
jgi:Holliday junction resolvase RusA-like endonuclease